VKFSICLPTGFEGVMYPIPFAALDDFVRLAVKCERLGYHSAWGNHHITAQNYVRALFPDTLPNFYDPLTVLSFCAANTRSIRLGTAVAVLPMRDPFWLPKQATSIKQLSGGRFILGVGVGAYREEFAAWAPRLTGKAMRGAMLDEGLSQLRRLSKQVSATRPT
jgi:alkanesulfonate monooxygenase SsuD/methylene tetrahydromethanopterin reductase-like flavin-dependent oxidoreductase (luciferase family)